MGRFLYRLLNGLFSLVMISALLPCGAYAVYALWDNSRIYEEASGVQADMLRVKPAADSPDGPSFEELRSINPDVCAWISLSNTKIDHPVLQGRDNIEYINRNVYGEFSLAGSIYLDARCAPDFGRPYALLYGHHMENGGMFGDLDLYKDKAFFEENDAGLLLLPGLTYELEIFACLIVAASDDYIFEPERWKDQAGELLDYVRQHALHQRNHVIDGLQSAKEPAIIALTTCSGEFTNARTVVLAGMRRQEGLRKEAAFE